MDGMNDLLEKGYAVPVAKEEVCKNDGKIWYLPHHPVINPNKEKIRIVFDCAAEYNGISLNSRVRQGPDLTNKLVGVLTRFRLHPSGYYGGYSSNVPPGTRYTRRSRRPQIPMVAGRQLRASSP